MILPAAAVINADRGFVNILIVLVGGDLRGIILVKRIDHQQILLKKVVAA
jgi:hypothetical protein